MTSLVVCGFECGQIGTVGQHWLVNTGSPSISTSTVRSGARSARFNPSASTASLGITLASSTRWVLRAYVYFATLPDAGVTLASPAGGSGSPKVYFDSADSSIYARVGTTSGVSGVAVTTGQWYRIDADFNIDTGGNDTCDVRVNGVACGQATAAGLGASQASFLVGPFGANHTSDVFFDDIVLSQTAGDYPIGAGYVHHFVPTADGSHNIAGANDYERGGTGTDITNATTDAYLLIDDVPLDDTTPDADDYINMIAPTANSYTEHVFGPAPGISTPTTGPRAVEVIAGIHQAGTGLGNMEILLNDNGSLGTVYTATGVAGTTTIIYKRAHFADPPSAASVWNAAGDGGDGDFLDLRVRFGATGTADANPDQFLDCIMVEAEFAEVIVEPIDITPRRFRFSRGMRPNKRRRAA